MEDVNATEEVTLKPEAIAKTETDETKDERKKRLNISDIPYHTYETEQAMIARDKEVADAGPVAYEYKANGYTVTEVEPETKDGLKKYKVTAEDFEKVFLGKRDAEIYVETHALAHKDLPATISK